MLGYCEDLNDIIYLSIKHGTLYIIISKLRAVIEWMDLGGFRQSSKVGLSCPWHPSPSVIQIPFLTSVLSLVY